MSRNSIPTIIAINGVHINTEYLPTYKCLKRLKIQIFKPLFKITFLTWVYSKNRNQYLNGNWNLNPEPKTKSGPVLGSHLSKNSVLESIGSGFVSNWLWPILHPYFNLQVTLVWSTHAICSLRRRKKNYLYIKKMLPTMWLSFLYIFFERQERYI